MDTENDDKDLLDDIPSTSEVINSLRKVILWMSAQVKKKFPNLKSNSQHVRNFELINVIKDLQDYFLDLLLNKPSNLFKRENLQILLNRATENRRKARYYLPTLIRFPYFKKLPKPQENPSFFC